MLGELRGVIARDKDDLKFVVVDVVVVGGEIIKREDRSW